MTDDDGPFDEWERVFFDMDVTVFRSGTHFHIQDTDLDEEIKMIPRAEGEESNEALAVNYARGYLKAKNLWRGRDTPRQEHM